LFPDTGSPFTEGVRKPGHFEILKQPFHSFPLVDEIFGFAVFTIASKPQLCTMHMQLSIAYCSLTSTADWEPKALQYMNNAMVD